MSGSRKFTDSEFYLFIFIILFGFILLTHKVYRDFQPSLKSSAGGVKGCLDLCPHIDLCMHPKPTLSNC